MKIGVLTGTGTYALPGLETRDPDRVDTRYGDALVTQGTMGDVDVLHVCTPNDSHAELAVLALRSGKHVVLEKPVLRLAVDAEDQFDAAGGGGHPGMVRLAGHRRPAAAASAIIPA